MHRGREVGSNVEIEKAPHRSETRDRDRHGGNGSTHNGTDGDTECESEEGVADGYNVARVEQAEGLVADTIERTRPPRCHQGEESGRHDAREPTDDYLRREPLRARRALRPGPPVRTGIEFASHALRR